ETVAARDPRMRQAEPRVGHRAEMRFARFADRPFARAVAAKEAGLTGAIIMLHRLGEPVCSRPSGKRAAGTAHQQHVGIRAEQARTKRSVDLAEPAGGDSEIIAVRGETADREGAALTH